MTPLRFITAIAALTVGGCASPHATTQVSDTSKKREEIQVLRAEIDQVILSLDHLQRELASKGTYSPKSQDRDLDYFISVLRQARDRVAAEDRRIHQQYKIGYGPY